MLLLSRKIGGNSESIVPIVGMLWLNRLNPSPHFHRCLPCAPIFKCSYTSDLEFSCIHKFIRSLFPATVQLLYTTRNHSHFVAQTVCLAHR